MVRHDGDIAMVRTAIGDLDHHWDRLLHLSGLPPSIQALALLRACGDWMGGHVTGTLDADQPQLVRNAVLYDGCLGCPRNCREAATVAMEAAACGGGGRRGGN